MSCRDVLRVRVTVNCQLLGDNLRFGQVLDVCLDPGHPTEETVQRALGMGIFVALPEIEQPVSSVRFPKVGGGDP